MFTRLLVSIFCHVDIRDKTLEAKIIGRRLTVQLVGSVHIGRVGAHRQYLLRITAALPALGIDTAWLRTN